MGQNRIISGLWMSCDASEEFCQTEAVGATDFFRLVQHTLKEQLRKSRVVG